MFCTKCGVQNKDGARFCEHCGASLLDEQPVNAAQSSPDTKENKENSKGYIAALAGIGVVVLILAVIIVFMLVKLSGKTSQNAESEDAEQTQVQKEQTDIQTAEGEDKSDSLGQIINCDSAQYNYTGLNTLDLSARNYSPNQKQEGMDWDSALFYTLEDVYTDSTQDNQIAGYQLLNYEFLNAQTGNIIRCVVYKNPENGQINKIVTIEQQNGSYVVSDYYYDNGKVNFVFTRNVDVYTPTYATIDKVGTRYYFNNDVMVRYRMIDVPKQIVQKTLKPADTWYPNTSYFTMGSEEMAEYDAVEYQVLNEAYNVYNAVLNQNSLFDIKGYVYSADKSPLANVSVAVITSADNSVLYSTRTAEDGSYHIYVLLDNTDCYLQIYLEGYLPVYIYNIKLDENLMGNSFSHIYLSGSEAEMTDTQLYLYNTIDLTGDAGTAPLQNAQVTVRSGLNTRSGESVATGSTGAEGVFTTSLNPGAYTAEYSLDGYMPTYENFYVTNDTCVVKGYTVSNITDNTEKVVLCWDSDIDLDLVLYTPERSVYGDMNYVSAKQPVDDYQDYLISDAVDSHCEVISISNELIGQYKIFVNDYTSFLNGIYDSNTLATSGARIYIYSKDGLIAVYYIDFNQSGIVWNVCEKGNGYHPCSIIFSNLQGYTLIDKTTITKDELLEMYCEFLAGNITADYEGNQITYDSLMWDVYGFNGQEVINEVPSQSFALTDYYMDNMPELQIYFYNEYWGCRIYTVKLVNSNLNIYENVNGSYKDSLIFYKDGTSCITSYMDMGERFDIFTDANNNPLAFYGYLSSEYSDDIKQEMQQEYQNAYNSGYKYVYITCDSEFDSYEEYNEKMDTYISEYCGEQVTFYEVNEASIREHMKWD